MSARDYDDLAESLCALIEDARKALDTVLGTGLVSAEKKAAVRDRVDVVHEFTDAYVISDPKHPEFHSTHADLWDLREGK